MMHIFPAGTLTRAALALGTIAVLAGCQNVPMGLDGLTPTAQPVAQAPALPAVLPDAKGEVIGSGPVRVALLLPRTAPGNAGTAANAFRNAAAMAMEDFGSGLQLVVKDTGGVATTATDAAGEAVNEGAAIVLGPLFAGNVSAVSGVLTPRNRLVMAFSSDQSVARRGVYLQSFLPGAIVERTLAYAASRGVKRIVAILPEGAFGNLAESQARQTITANGGQLIAVTRYAYDDASVEKAALDVLPMLAQADGVFIPDGGNTPGAVVAAITRNGGVLTGKRLLGSGQWAGADLSNPVFAGGWFADTDQSRLGEFKARYKAKFGTDAIPTSALAYDAVALVAGLAKNGGAAGITAQAIESPGGFNGYGGVFRFLANGTTDRGFAVYEIASGGTTIVSPAPRTFATN